MELSSASRLVFPDDGITKGDVYDYYRLVGPVLLPYVKDRALTVERYPKGIGQKGFMQKNVPQHAPNDLIGRCEVQREEGGVTTYPVVGDVNGLLFFANLGVITFHAPPTTVDSLSFPDWIIWDLDPSTGAIDEVRRAALTLRELLRSFSIPTSLMASGSKGYHLRTRIRPNVAAELISELARGIAALAEAANPDLMTLAFKKADRGNRVFVDWLRNMPLSTSVSPWSLRPIPGAPIASPTSWSELEDISPDGITLASVKSRLTADVWGELPPIDVTDTVHQVKRALADSRISLEPFDRFRS